MPLIRISNPLSTRSYYVDSSWDSFISRMWDSVLCLPQYLCEELIAYYNGDVVTERLITLARAALCEPDAPLPLPIKSIGRHLLIKCIDGEVNTLLDIGTFARHSDYVRDLYSIDDSLTSVDVPFDMETVSNLLLVLAGMKPSCQRDCSQSLIPIMKFLRPVRASMFLDGLHCQQCAKEDLSFLTDVGKWMDWEDKVKSAPWAKLIADDGMWSLIEHLHERRMFSAIEVLLKDRPTALIVYYLDKSFDKKVVDLLCLDEFNDRGEVDPSVDPSLFIRMIDSLLLNLSFVTDAEKMVKLLTVLGIRDVDVPYCGGGTKFPLVYTSAMTPRQAQSLLNYYYRLSGTSPSQQLSHCSLE